MKIAQVTLLSSILRLTAIIPPVNTQTWRRHTENFRL